jgi:hypothetical protein
MSEITHRTSIHRILELEIAPHFLVLDANNEICLTKQMAVTY